MKAIALATVMLSIASMAAAAETNRHGDLIIRTSPQTPTAQQRRVDPDLDRLPGLTPLERRTTNQDGVPTDRPAPKSMCRSAWSSNNSATVCY
jgi:hypothetical protein